MNIDYCNFEHKSNGEKAHEYTHSSIYVSNIHVLEYVSLNFRI